MEVKTRHSLLSSIKVNTVAIEKRALESDNHQHLSRNTAPNSLQMLKWASSTECWRLRFFFILLLEVWHHCDSPTYISNRSFFPVCFLHLWKRFITINNHSKIDKIKKVLFWPQCPFLKLYTNLSPLDSGRNWKDWKKKSSH